MGKIRIHVTEISKGDKKKMSTRSYICVEKEDGTYIGSYCHHDGYLDYNGAILIDYYADREKVEKLLSLGDMSCLAPKTDIPEGMQHSFNKPLDDVCVFYGRDRGEHDTGPKEITLEELSDDIFIEYTYVYTLDGQWKYFEYQKYKEGLRDVKEDLDAAFSRYGIERPKDSYGIYTDKIIRIIQAIQTEDSKQRFENDKS